MCCECDLKNEQEIKDDEVMHGLTTLVGINRRNAEAERIMRQYAKQDGRQEQPEPQKEQKQEPATD